MYKTYILLAPSLYFYRYDRLVFSVHYKLCVNCLFHTLTLVLIYFFHVFPPQFPHGSDQIGYRLRSYL
jgi:hypothetical protein